MDDITMPCLHAFWGGRKSALSSPQLIKAYEDLDQMRVRS